MYKIFCDEFNIIEINEKKIRLFIANLDILFERQYDEISETAELIGELELEDQILMTVEYKNDEVVIFYCIDKKLKIVKQISGRNLDNEFKIKVKNNNENLRIWRYGIGELAVVDSQKKIILKTEEFLTKEKLNVTEKYDLKRDNKSRFQILSIANYDKYNLVLTYDNDRKEFNLCKVIISAIKENKNLDVSIRSRNDIFITNNIDKCKKIVNLRKLKKGKSIKLFDHLIKNVESESIIAIYAFDRARYYIYNTTRGVYICKSDGKKVTGANLNLKVHMSKKNMYVYGRMTHYGMNSFGKYDQLYTMNSDKKVAKFKRPLGKVRFLKRFGYFKVPYEVLNKENKIHQNLLVGNEEFYVHNLYFKESDEKVKTYNYISDKEGNNVNIVRTNLQGNITYTNIPYSKEYSKLDKFKILFAKWLSNNKKEDKNINLFFEKKSSKADESGFRVFEEAIKSNSEISNNYFILDESCPEYKNIKEKYGKNVVSKNSFKHYYLIFKADNFISSELSNHVLNDRLFINSLKERVLKVPLIFLQHGIMFAKPVDNPMAFGFHKDKNPYNIYKNVISSELEAKEFYKMNYDRSDLILTGLATLDYAKLSAGANKIAYMPTYRYWEEGLVYSNKIEETTFYKTIIKVIDAFEKAGLIDRLLIVPHNKFSEYICKNMPQYEHILSDNPSEALKVSKIFITDYSSAIYDAQFRGAYPIFYWEEKDYLIEKYKAIPPVNEKNAPGPIAMNVDELISIVNKAIKSKYKLEKSYIKKYKKINTFGDRKNTQRIIKYLKKENII